MERNRQDNNRHLTGIKGKRLSHERGTYPIEIVFSLNCVLLNLLFMLTSFFSILSLAVVFGGYESAKSALREVMLLPRTRPQLFTALGVSPPKGTCYSCLLLVN